MSTEVLTWVFKRSEAGGNDRLVLLAIADEADDDGTNAFPSIDRIAMKCRVPKRTVMRCLSRLEESGGLIVHRPEKRGRGHFNTYVVVMEKGDTVTPEKDVTVSPDDDGEKARKGAQRRAPLPDPFQTHRPIDPTTTSESLVVVPIQKPERACRLPDEFLLTPAMREWAQTEAPHVDLRSETAKFCDYWRSESGAKARKLDWTAAWRNWIRRAGERNGNGRTNGHRTMTKREESFANLEAWAAAQTAAEKGAIGR